MASIGATAFLDDPFDTYLYPTRKSNQKAYQRLYRQKIEAVMHEPLTWVIAAEVPVSTSVSTYVSSHPVPMVLAGYAIWTRESSEKVEKDTRKHLRTAGLHDLAATQSLAGRIKHRLRNLSIVESVRERSNPIIDRKRASKFWRECMAQEESMDEPGEHWYLMELAVAPDYRRQGVGRGLLNWGLNWARREGLMVLLDSTPMGRELYRGAGFVKRGIWRWGTEADMVWDLMYWSPPAKHVRSEGLTSAHRI